MAKRKKKPDLQQEPQEEAAPVEDKNQAQLRIAAKKRAMAVALATNGIVSKSAKAVGITPKTHWKWRKEDPEYAADIREANFIYKERLEAEADRRAVDGVIEEIFDKEGNVIGQRTKYSDSLLMFRLKALDRKKYGDRTEVSLKDKVLNERIEKLLEAVGLRREASPSGSPGDRASFNGFSHNGHNGHA